MAAYRCMLWTCNGSRREWAIVRGKRGSPEFHVVQKMEGGTAIVPPAALAERCAALNAGAD